ncbi:PQ-loop domain-containing transporter [[Mycoplasma] anseris]|uniref:PQ loop repeat protein n=1 Tax=[Mycoplasma] anseris TaxID=92400 RepID=A0A2Z4NDR3_9BACT|nr:PQ-loop domain-containing transporter [[Mycoplasma] anseris]AWX69732.1 hypothetical protein DP065_03265 [[Mycoplasma] anseris]
MEIAIQVFGILGAICTIGLGLPQLIHQLKVKKTGDVNFVSFWVFYLGLLVWIIFGTFQSGDITAKPYIFVANFVCIMFYSATVYFVYYYHPKVQTKTKKLILIPILLVIFSSLILFVVFVLRATNVILKADFGETGTKIFGFIAPSFTTLAFLPQIIQNFKNNDFSGVTPYMPLLYLFNNANWILNFSLLIASSHDSASIGGLTWQIISSIIFGIQFFATIIWLNKQKKQQKIVENELNQANKQLQE